MGSNIYYLNNMKYFYHITSIENLQGILNYGLQNHYTSYKKIDISNQDVNKRREIHEPIFNRKIHEYAPLYFNHKNRFYSALYKRYFMKDLILRVTIIFIVIMAVYLTIPSKNVESLYMETQIFFGTICLCILVVLTISDFNK